MTTGNVVWNDYLFQGRIMGQESVGQRAFIITFDSIQGVTSLVYTSIKSEPVSKKDSELESIWKMKEGKANKGGGGEEEVKSFWQQTVIRVGIGHSVWFRHWMPFSSTVWALQRTVSRISIYTLFPSYFFLTLAAWLPFQYQLSTIHVHHILSGIKCGKRSRVEMGFGVRVRVMKSQDMNSCLIFCKYSNTWNITSIPSSDSYFEYDPFVSYLLYKKKGIISLCNDFWFICWCLLTCSWRWLAHNICTMKKNVQSVYQVQTFHI